MPHDDTPLLRRHWAVEAPAPDLADRILAHALAQPQRSSFARQWKAFVERMQTPGPARGFAFAACLVVAVIAFNPQADRKTSTPTSSASMERMVEQFIWDDYRY